MKKYNSYILTGLLSLCTLPTIKSMQSTITELGQQEKIKAHITLTSNPNKSSLFYGLTAKFDSGNENPLPPTIEPFVPVKRTSCKFLNTETQEQIDDSELNLAYYPDKFPLAPIVEQKEIKGFVQIGAVSNDENRQLFKYFGTFSSSKKYIPVTEYDGVVRYDEDSCFTIPVIITFQDPSNIIQKQAENFTKNPQLEPGQIYSYENALAWAEHYEILETTAPQTKDNQYGIQHGEKGFTHKRKLEMFEQKIKEDGGMFRAIDNMRYGNRFKRRKMTTTQQTVTE